MGRQKPHICFVALNAWPLLVGDEQIEIIGGAELQQVIVAKALAKRGYQVSMLCLDFGQQDGIEVDGIRVFKAFRPHEGVPILRFLWPRLTSVWQALGRIDADIYYQRTAGVVTGIVVAFCRRKKKKSVFAVAGEPMIRFKRDRWIYEYGVRHTDRILVQNSKQGAIILEQFRRASVIVPNCYVACGSQSTNSKDRILWVSTIRSIKRPGYFIDLAKSLPQYRFRMIGGIAPEEPMLFNQVKDRAAAIGNVEFMGFVPRAKIGQQYGVAALLVNTSETEGFPNTFLEAWSLGIPTVSFVDSGARYAGSTVGRLVNNCDEMREAVFDLMCNESLRKLEATRCKEYVDATHCTDQVIGQYEEILSELVAS